jgi:hypothetical protein
MRRASAALRVDFTRESLARSTDTGVVAASLTDGGT